MVKPLPGKGNRPVGDAMKYETDGQSFVKPI